VVKEMVRYGADLSDFVPRQIIQDVQDKMNEQIEKEKKE
jgi:pantetheine-phosphate adenylyltransferase